MGSLQENEEKKDQVNQLLDKLTLNALILMERQIQNKINLENSMMDGELYLAKSRYIMGHKNVSSVQLPNSNDNYDIDPIVSLEEVRNEDMFGQLNLSMKVEKPSHTEDSGERSCQNPIKWFGVLVPSSLHLAQSRFKSAISWAVDCVNIQLKLRETLIKIYQFRELKQKFD